MSTTFSLPALPNRHAVQNPVVWIIVIAMLAAPAEAPATANLPQSNLPQGNLQCVPYARQVSGIQIFGDAHSWWGQAAGRYQRGTTPRKGAVLSLKPHGRMRLGHIAVVSKIVDNRKILIDHANWSPINGQRGQIERGVAAVDVSPDNDWSAVRIWYAPIRALGTTAYPVNGFIYARRDDGTRNSPGRHWASASKPLENSKKKREKDRASTIGDDPIGDLIAQLGV